MMYILPYFTSSSFFASCWNVVVSLLMSMMYDVSSYPNLNPELTSCQTHSRAGPTAT